MQLPIKRDLASIKRDLVAIKRDLVAIKPEYRVAVACPFGYTAHA